MLLVVSGLPGTGKTSVAREVARRLDAVHLSVDPVEDAMIGAGLPSSWSTGVAAYEVTRAVAEDNLSLGRQVVVDAVNDSGPARDTWRRAAQAAGTGVRFVLLTLADTDEHRRRLETRGRRFAHVEEPTWAEVTERAGRYAPWSDPVVRLDAAAPLTELVDAATRALLP